MSIVAEAEIAKRRDETAKISTPHIKILFLPYISATLPKGTTNVAAARRYAVATQPNEIASIANSLPIEGSAMLTEEPIKGAKKAPNVATIKAAFLFAALSTFVVCVMTNLKSIPQDFTWQAIRPNCRIVP